MHTAEVRFRLSGKSLVEPVRSLLEAWRTNGQVLGRSWSMAEEGNSLRAFVSIPEHDSLGRRFDSSHVAAARVSLEDMSAGPPEISVIGLDPESSGACECKRPSWFILYTSHVGCEGPIRCGTCFRTVPLYTIPTSDDDHWAVLAWESDYKACDALQMGCVVGERFGLQQLEEAESALANHSRRVAIQIEDDSGVPTFHVLLKMNGQSAKKEARRRCPLCGVEWALAERLHGLFDFR